MSSRRRLSPSPALLVLHKDENAMAIINLKSLTQLTRLKTGQGPDNMV